MLEPLKRVHFRWLWAGMGLSYSGDRLQELAQGWLVATITGSALAVGGIGVISSIPMLFMPLGGAIADQLNRRRILITGQWVGAVITGIMAYLAFSKHIAVWHVYVWAFISGVVWMIIRPAYKVIITELVPLDEVRPAVSLNSITETSAIAIMNAGGSGLIGWLGLPIAFLLNSASYIIAIFCLGKLRGVNQLKDKVTERITIIRMFINLKVGLLYLTKNKALLYPLLITLIGVIILGAPMSVLPAIVYKQNGNIVQLGLLAAAFSLGALCGALYAGMKNEGKALRTYSFFGLIAAASLTIFAIKPVSVTGAIGLYVIGFLAFAQAVWNTSRVPRLAEPEYQARLQALTSMAFTLGGPLGALWGGAAVDRFGQSALMAGAGILAVISIILLVLTQSSTLKMNFGGLF